MKANPTYAESLPPVVTETLNLFSEVDDHFRQPVAKTRASDPETSHEAAKTVTAETMRIQHLRIVEVLRYADAPLSDQQIIDAYEGLWGPCAHSGLRTRRSELTRSGFVRRVAYGKTAAGRRCHLHGLMGLEYS